MVKKCLLDGSTKMEGDFSEKMRLAVLHSKEKQKGNGHKLHHGKLRLDTKNSLSESVRCQTKFPRDSVEFPGRVFKKEYFLFWG